MAYEIVMPQLSDSMEEGKLISWKVKEGEQVKKGDIIAEVESDKAIMEVQSFQDGVVQKLQVHEGESVPVGTVIAILDTNSSEQKTKPSSPAAVDKKEHEPKMKQKPVIEDIQQHSDTSFLDEILGLSTKSESETPPQKVEGTASPKAKALAAKYKLDLRTLQQNNKLPVPAHEKDILHYYRTHLFTPKALKLIDLYELDPTLFDPTQKHDSADILDYIKTHDIPLPKPLTSFQKALIKSVENAAQKPTYHVFDIIDTSIISEHKSYSLTVALIQLFAKAMMFHEVFRSVLQNDKIITYPNASIALAVAHEEYLYMPVFKDANLLKSQEIHNQLQIFKDKAINNKMEASDMQGSTFAISNLGMLGIERFDAMINKDDSAIAAIGAVKNKKMSITLTLDHRLINGYQAAQFMQTLKTLALDATLFKE